jgi:DnaJ like chaperone protein
VSAGSQFNIPKHWWGKILGAALGLFRGGISGLLIGALLGHLVDRFIAGIVGVSKTQQTFFDALFSSLGHLSKADGQVTQTEIRMVEDLMAQMHITGDHRQRAIRLFKEGKSAGFSVEAALRPFLQASAVRQDLRQMFLEILVEAAFSSGSVSAEETAVLQKVATELRIPAQMFAAMMAARSGGYGGAYGPAGGQGAGRKAPGHNVATLDQAYAQLGLKPSASDSEVKRAYRKLVSQYHPDKLVSRGLPEEMMDMAKTRVREINTAYDQIKQTRGFK